MVAFGDKLVPSDKCGEGAGQSGLGRRLDQLLCNLLIPLIITYSHYGERNNPPERLNPFRKMTRGEIWRAQ